MKKKIFTGCIAVFIVLIIFFILDYIVAYKRHVERINLINSKMPENNKLNLEKFPINYLKTFYFEDFFDKNIKNNNIPIFGFSYKEKKPVLLFGCSFACGTGLKKYATLGSLLSIKTKRSVYNLCHEGMGASPALFYSSNEKLYNYIKNKNNADPEYAIYVYMFSHNTRIFEDKYCYFDFNHKKIGYNQRKGQLIYSRENLFSLLAHTAIGKALIYRYLADNVFINKNYMNSIMKKYFLQINKELKKKYPNIKFIILKYPSPLDIDRDYYYSNIFKDLEKEGIIIYDLEEKINVDLKDTEYLLADYHPDAQAWRIIVTQLIKDMNM